MYLLKSVALLLCWCTVLSKASCPSFTSSVEEGRAVCPGEELTYTCTIFDNTSIFPAAVWRGFCADINIAHGFPAQESGMCGPFVVNATGSDGDCYTSTLTVTVSLELNGTFINCSHESVEVGRATLVVTDPPSPIPTQNSSTETLTSTTIEWSVPGDSGADITSYTITYTSESGEGVESVDGSATSALLTGLTPNVDYEANITASNCAGTSEPTAFSFRINGTVPPKPTLITSESNCIRQYDNFTVMWTIPRPPPPPPAYQPFWVNITVEEDGSVTDSAVMNASFNTNYTYSLENATLEATYTITVSAVNQLGWSGSNITVYTCSDCADVYTCVSQTSATPRVPSATPSPGLYATPTVTATSSPTDPTTTAGAPFSLAPIVAPVVAITILLLLAAVLVIALVLGWKYGRKLNRKKRVNQNPYIEQSEVLGLRETEGPGNHPQPLSGYSLVQYSTEDDSVAITDERTANTGGGGGGTAHQNEITDDIQFDMETDLIGEGGRDRNVTYAQLATVSDRQRPIAPPPLDTKVVYSVIKPQAPPVNRHLKPQEPAPPMVNRNLKPTVLLTT